MKWFRNLTITLIFVTPTLFAGELKLNWIDSEDFRDADYYYNGSDKSTELVLTNLEKYFTRQAEKRIPEGYSLEMAVTELDLAGDFEPWHGINMQDVRIIKEIYPARIEFDFKLIGPDGNVIAEGSEVLRDRMVPDPITSMSIGRSELYPYIKELVRDWMRKLVKDIEK